MISVIRINKVGIEMYSGVIEGKRCYNWLLFSLGGK